MCTKHLLKSWSKEQEFPLGSYSRINKTNCQFCSFIKLHFSCLIPESCQNQNRILYKNAIHSCLDEVKDKNEIHKKQQLPNASKETVLLVMSFVYLHRSTYKMAVQQSMLHYIKSTNSCEVLYDL